MPKAGFEAFGRKIDQQIADFAIAYNSQNALKAAYIDGSSVSINHFKKYANGSSAREPRTRRRSHSGPPILNVVRDDQSGTRSIAYAGAAEQMPSRFSIHEKIGIGSRGVSASANRRAATGKSAAQTGR